jgi:hypothetical protein
MKIDISKAFDTLSWEFLLEMLRRRRFGGLFRNLICGILPSARTSVMINGERGAPFSLARGVRQGDPLAPTLFILTMDSLQAMMQWVVDHGLLADLGLNQRIPKVSLYADDIVLFSDQGWETWSWSQLTEHFCGRLGAKSKPSEKPHFLHPLR